MDHNAKHHRDTIPPFELSEQEIRKLFRHPNRLHGNARLIWQITSFLGSFIATFAVFFFLLNLPAYYKRIAYIVTPKPPQLISLPDQNKVLDDIARSNPQTAPAAQTDHITPQNIGDNRIIIPKINVDAPIEWDIPNNQMIERLRDGVTHYQGTAHPGEIGNIFITGHSSNFWWDKGQFNQVFALLDKLAPNDDIFVSYKGATYHFVVQKSVIVKPTQIDVLNPTDTPILSLMTCNPVGTTINRLIVQSKQVTPLGSASPINTTPSLPTNLPAIR